MRPLGAPPASDVRKKGEVMSGLRVHGSSSSVMGRHARSVVRILARHRSSGARFPKLRKSPLAIVGLYLWVFGVVSASAHVSPANCSGNTVALSMNRSPNPVVQGNVVTYNVGISNVPTIVTP